MERNPKPQFNSNLIFDQLFTGFIEMTEIPSLFRFCLIARFADSKVTFGLKDIGWRP